MKFGTVFIARGPKCVYTAGVATAVGHVGGPSSAITAVNDETARIVVVHRFARTIAYENFAKIVVAPRLPAQS